jgi:acyl-CoA thioesterase-1
MKERRLISGTALIVVAVLVGCRASEPVPDTTTGSAELRQSVGGQQSQEAGAAFARSASAPEGERREGKPSGTSTAPLPRVVVLGDSLTAGLGLPVGAAFPGLLQSHLDRAGHRVEVVNAGVSGDTTAGGLRRLEWALAGDVRILIVALGGNDGLRGLPVDEVKRNLETIVERAAQRGVQVLLAGMEAPPNFGPAYTAGFRQVFRDVAARHRVTFVPFLLTGVAGNADLNQADGIHPNAEGARMIADHLWPVLEPMVRAQAGVAAP